MSLDSIEYFAWDKAIAWTVEDRHAYAEALGTDTGLIFLVEEEEAVGCDSVDGACLAEEVDVEDIRVGADAEADDAHEEVDDAEQSAADAAAVAFAPDVAVPVVAAPAVSAPDVSAPAVSALDVAALDVFALAVVALLAKYAC